MARLTVFILVVACLVSTKNGYSLYLTVPHDDGLVKTVYESAKSINGSCVCQIEIPSIIKCIPTVEHGGQMTGDDLSQLSLRMDEITRSIEAQDEQMTSVTNNMTSVLERLESIESGNLVISKPEFELFRREIENMESLLILLRHNSTASRDVAIALEAEVLNMTNMLRNLEGQDDSYNEHLLEEIDDLKKRLTNCQHEVDDKQMEMFFSYNWDKPGTSDSCKKLVNVSAPYTVKQWSDALIGTWFRDPVKDTRKVYVLPVRSSSSYNRQSYIEVYASMRTLQFGTKERRITLTESAHGTGMVAYNGSIYYQIYNSRQIGRYDIAHQRLQKSTLPSTTLISNQGSYLSGSYSDIDFAVDESGVWVIFATSSSNGVMVISKLDPDTLLRTDTWTTSVSKSSQGNCFVTCHVLHCTNSYNTHADKINYFFDTKSSMESFMYVPIDSKYLATYSLTYNPYDQKLYGWDKGHQVIYQLIFEE